MCACMRVRVCVCVCMCGSEDSLWDLFLIFHHVIRYHTLLASLCGKAFYLQNYLTGPSQQFQWKKDLVRDFRGFSLWVAGTVTWGLGWVWIPWRKEEAEWCCTYLEPVSYFLSFVIQGPGHGAPTFRTDPHLVNTLKPPSQMEWELCLCNLQGASQRSGVRTKANPHAVINMWLTLGSVAE